jgi:quercetin dioxygenase-like cupin family protein
MAKCNISRAPRILLVTSPRHARDRLTGSSGKICVRCRYGDASKEGLFAVRIKVPKGYRVSLHTHPKPEIVTVLAGSVRLGMAQTPDPAKEHVFPAGSFYATPPGMVHYFSADEDTVVQVNSTGPWGINYVNAKDDPRQKSQ